MFTGIIEEVGTVEEIVRQNENIIVNIRCSFIDEIKIDQSIAHDGVCLTVTDLKNKYYSVTIIEETLRKSNLGKLKKGDKINLERSMRPDGRLDGHIVQGHVDQTAECSEIINENGSWIFTFKYDKKYNNLTVEKGSVAINGVSLTVINSVPGKFSVAIIPYTYDHTNFKNIKTGSIVNLEFDIIGKYVQQYLRNSHLISKD